MRPVIAYPGVAGSFSESAAQCAFPQGETRGYATFAQAAEAAQNGAADYALLPVENSFAGAVLPTYGLLEGLQLHIVGETLRRVRHQLVALPGATIEGLRTISSHPQAIAQCDAFLATVPWARLVPSANTAISAQEVAASGDLTRAAIASTRAAEVSPSSARLFRRIWFREENAVSEAEKNAENAIKTISATKSVILPSSIIKVDQLYFLIIIC